ncbi:MAG: hypothetical protein U0L12_07450, partial [Ruminococcus sp.]|nr:hypothetical protein [Ruminococcus sp.]
VDPTGDSPDATDPDSANEEETEPEELVSLDGLEMMTAPIMSRKSKTVIVIFPALLFKNFIVHQPFFFF